MQSIELMLAATCCYPRLCKLCYLCPVIPALSRDLVNMVERDKIPDQIRHDGGKQSEMTG